MSRNQADIRLIWVFVVGAFLASVVLAFSIYSGFRWIGDAGWLWASTPGFRWVPLALAYGALVAALVGAAMAVIVFWKGRWMHRLLVAPPSLLLFAYLLFAALKTLFPGL